MPRDRRTRFFRFPHTVLSLGMIASALLFAASLVSAAALMDDGDILDLAGMDVSRIEIVRGDLLTIVEIQGDEWRVVEPLEAKADQREVEEFLARLGNLTVADVLEGNPAAFGLAPPKATVRLSDDSGASRELFIGNLRSPVSLFVQPAQSDVVYAISNVSLERLGSYPMGFVDRVLLELEPDQVEAIAVAYAPPEVEDEEEAQEGRDLFVSKHASGSWTMEEGSVAFDVDGFLEAVRLLQAVDRDDEVGEDVFFPNPDSARFLLDVPNVGEIAVDVGRRTPDGDYRYVRVDGRQGVYLMPLFYAEQVIRRALRINDSLVTFNVDDISQLSVTPVGGQTVDFSRSQGKWQSNRAVAFGVGPLLDAISSVGAAGAALTLDDPAGYGFGAAPNGVTVNIVFANRTTLELQLGGPVQGGDGIYVASSGRPGVYVGYEESAAAIREALAGVRNVLYPINNADVASIDIAAVDADSGEERALVLNRQGDGWVKGDGGAADATRVNSLLTAMGRLAADDLPPMPDEATLGMYPLPGGYRVTVTFNDGLERTLDIGAKILDGEVGSWFASYRYYVQVSDLEELAFAREADVNGILNAINVLW